MGKGDIVESLSNLSPIKLIGSDNFDLKKTIKNFTLLCWRAFAEQSRDVASIGIRLTTTIFFSLIIGGIYSNIGNSQESIQNREGLLYFIAINQMFGCLFPVLNTFPKEKFIVNRERSCRAYSTLSYFCAKVIVEMPLTVLPTLLYAIIVYWLVQLNPYHFIEFALVLMLLSVAAVSLGLAVSALVPTIETANAIGPPCLIIAILFGGFYISIDSKLPYSC